jgi:hypothetical protein
MWIVDRIKPYPLKTLSLPAAPGEFLTSFLPDPPPVFLGYAVSVTSGLPFIQLGVFEQYLPAEFCRFVDSQAH